MKNLVIQRGLVCLSESEFKRAMTEISALESANVQLKKELEESNKRVALLEDTLRFTESELKKRPELP